jgi:hypothetical protein
VRPEGLGKLKKSVHLFRSRTSDLPACHTIFTSSVAFSRSTAQQIFLSSVLQAVMSIENTDASSDMSDDSLACKETLLDD